MEISSIRGLPEMGIIDDPNYFLHQWNSNSIDTIATLTSSSAFEEALQKHLLISNNQNFNTKSTSMETSPAGSTDHQRPTKQLKSNSSSSWNKISPHHETLQYAAPSCSNLLSFAHDHDHVSNYTSTTDQLGVVVKPKVEEIMCYPIPNQIDNNNNTTTLANMLNISQGNLVNHHQNHVFKAYHDAKNIENTRPQAHDHIVAERKRREKLSQRFIALSALVPNLQKMDKASVLGEAIKYLKQMQEKVSVLEEEKKRKKTVESVVVVKKSQLSDDAEDSSSSDIDETILPEIEARFCERNVLIRLHCLKSKGVIEKTVSEIEKLHLKVINSSALTFGSFTLDITIIAQMEMEFSMTVKDLVRNLRSAFSSFM